MRVRVAVQIPECAMFGDEPSASEDSMPPRNENRNVNRYERKLSGPDPPVAIEVRRGQGQEQRRSEAKQTKRIWTVARLRGWDVEGIFVRAAAQRPPAGHEARFGKRV